MIDQPNLVADIALCAQVYHIVAHQRLRCVNSAELREDLTTNEEANLGVGVLKEVGHTRHRVGRDAGAVGVVLVGEQDVLKEGRRFGEDLRVERVAGRSNRFVLRDDSEGVHGEVIRHPHVLGGERLSKHLKVVVAQLNEVCDDVGVGNLVVGDIGSHRGDDALNRLGEGEFNADLPEEGEREQLVGAHSAEDVGEREVDLNLVAHHLLGGGERLAVHDTGLVATARIHERLEGVLLRLSRVRPGGGRNGHALAAVVLVPLPVAGVNGTLSRVAFRRHMGVGHRRRGAIDLKDVLNKHARGAKDGAVDDRRGGTVVKARSGGVGTTAVLGEVLEFKVEGRTGGDEEVGVGLEFEGGVLGRGERGPIHRHLLLRPASYNHGLDWDFVGGEAGRLRHLVLKWYCCKFAHIKG